MTTTKLAWAVAIAASVLAGACDFGPSVEGELRRGRFVYTCVEDTDALCSGFDNPEAFPAVFGPGARFSVSYDPRDDDAIGITVEPSSTELIAFEDDVLTWRVNGEASLIALLDGELYDFANVRAQEVDHVRLSGTSEENEVVLEAGQTRVLSAIPQDEHGRRLGGALDYSWTVEDPEVATIDGESFLERVKVVGGTTGATSLVLEVGGSEHRVPIVVGPTPRDPCDRADLTQDGCIWCRAEKGLPWDDC